MGRSPKQTYVNKLTEYIQDGLLNVNHTQLVHTCVHTNPWIMFWKGHTAPSDPLGEEKQILKLGIIEGLPLFYPKFT